MATSPAASDPVATRAPIAIGAALLLCAIVAAVDLGGPIFYPGLGKIAAEFGVTPAEAQFTVTVMLIGAAASQPFLGPLGDRFGRSRVLITSLLALASLSLLTAAITDFTTLIVVRGAQGFLGSAGIVLARAIAHDLFPDQRNFTRVVSYLVVTTGACSLIGPLLASGLVSAYGWRAPVLLLGIFSAIVAVAALIWFRRVSRDASGSGDNEASWPGWRALWALLRHPTFFGSTALLGFSMASLFTLFGLSPLMLAADAESAPMNVGLVISILSLGFMAGAFAAGLRIATVLMVRAASVLIGVGFAVIALMMMTNGASLLTIVPGGLIVAVASGYLNPVTLSLALTADPRLVGTASGWSSAISLAIAAAGTQLATVVYGADASWLFAIGGAYALLCLICAVPMMRGSKTPPVPAA